MKEFRFNCIAVLFFSPLKDPYSHKGFAGPFNAAVLPAYPLALSHTRYSSLRQLAAEELHVRALGIRPVGFCSYP